MNRWRTGLAGLLTCALLSGCIFESSNSTADEEESDNNTNVSNPLERNVQYMTLFNCLTYLNGTVFWKERFADDSTALKYTFPPSGINPAQCPTAYQSRYTLNFTPGVTYDVWVMRVDQHCFKGGDAPNEVDPRDSCFVSDRFIVNGTNNNKTTVVRID